MFNTKLQLASNHFQSTLNIKDSSKISRLSQLQNNLLRVWSEKHVQEYYQNLFLKYLDRYPPQSAEMLISKQLKLTHQNKSYFFFINSHLEERKKYINALQNIVEKLQNKQIQEEDLEIICEFMSQVRQSSLLCAQSLLKLYNKYCSNGESSENGFLISILQKLDSDLQFLKSSFMKEFIAFQNGFDPFFIHQYEILSKTDNLQHNKQVHPAVEKLFNLNISYAFRLMKTRTIILELLSSGQPNPHRSSTTPDDEFGSSDLFSKPYFPSYSSTIPHSIQSIYDQRTPIRKRYSKQLIPSQSKEKTSVNFRKKTLSLKKAKQRQQMERKLNNLSSKTQGNEEDESSIYRRRVSLMNNSRVHNFINKEKLRDLSSSQDEFEAEHQKPVQRKYKIPEQSYGDEGQSEQEQPEEQYYKLVPIKYRIKKRYSHRLNRISEEPYQIVTIQNEKEHRMANHENINFRTKLNPINNQKRMMNNSQLMNDEPIPYKEKSNPINTIYDPRSFQKGKHTQKEKRPTDHNTMPPQNTATMPAQQQQKYPQQIQRSNLQSNNSNQNQIKMKPGKLTYQNLVKYIKQLNICQKSRKSYEELHLESSLSKNQYYLLEFYNNQNLIVLCLCSPIQERNYVIKFWAEIDSKNNLSKEIIEGLFKKYVLYLQKMTHCQEIYYIGQDFQYLQSNNFILKSQTRNNIFFKKRSEPLNSKKLEFEQFFMMKNSNILINQLKVSENVLYSEEIQEFTESNWYCQEAIALVDEKKIKKIEDVLKIEENLESMIALNKKLEVERLDTYEMSEELQINKITLITGQLHSPFKSSWIAGEGYLKFQGDELFKTEKSLTCSVNLSKNNSRLLFGKGYNGVPNFISSIRKEAKSSITFSVKMFNKQLYGRLKSKKYQNVGCYANWQFTLVWQDELQGRIKHQMTNCTSFGPEHFYVAIEVQSEVLYAFEVNQDDFLM